MIDIIENDKLVKHAYSSDGEMWEFECNQMGPEYGDMPRTNYTEEMYKEMLDNIGSKWVGEYSLFGKPFTAYQTRKMIKELARRGLVERTIVVMRRKTWFVRRKK